jgi:hypothetical protein
MAPAGLSTLRSGGRISPSHPEPATRRIGLLTAVGLAPTGLVQLVARPGATSGRTTPSILPSAGRRVLDPGGRLEALVVARLRKLQLVPALLLALLPATGAASGGSHSSKSSSKCDLAEAPSLDRADVSAEDVEGRAWPRTHPMRL